MREPDVPVAKLSVQTRDRLAALDTDGHGGRVTSDGMRIETKCEKEINFETGLLFTLHYVSECSHVRQYVCCTCVTVRYIESNRLTSQVIHYYTLIT